MLINTKRLWSYLIKYLSTFYSVHDLIKSIDTDPEKARKEKILNITCLTLSVVIFFMLLLSIFTTFSADNYLNYHPISLFTLFCIFLIPILCLYLSKKGKVKISSSILLGSVYISVCFASINWGADLPSVLLFLIVLIYLSGILIRSRIALIMSVISFIHLYIFYWLQKNDYLVYASNWRITDFNFDDVLEYSTIIILGAIFSWLGNKGYEDALQKSYAAENLLLLERNSLEEKVQERTSQIYSLQIEKINSMYRMVEFGRISSGLFHDIMSPLTHLSLSLHNKDYEGIKQITDNIIPSINKIQDIITYSKKHTRLDAKKEKFDCTKEIEQCLEILKSKISLNNIRIIKNYQQCLLYCAPAFFAHVVINLLSNAIDSYSSNFSGEKILIIQTRIKNKKLYIHITDKGLGIAEEFIKNIFEPFYSTKGDQGCGIGLSATKHILEKYLNGKIYVKSKINKGSTFSVEIPLEESD